MKLYLQMLYKSCHFLEAVRETVCSALLISLKSLFVEANSNWWDNSKTYIDLLALL